MAISVWSGTGTVNASTTGTTVSLPGTPAEDDICIVFIANDIPTQFPALVSSAGWEVFYLDNLGVLTLAGYWKRMGSTPDTGIDIDNDELRDHAVLAYTIRGIAANVSPFAGLIDESSGAGSTFDPPSHTPDFDGTLIITAMAIDDTDDAMTAGPSGYSNFTAIGGDQISLAAATKTQATAAAEDPGVFTLSGANDDWSGITFSLREETSPAIAAPAITIVQKSTALVEGSSVNVSLNSLQEDDLVIVYRARDISVANISGYTTIVDDGGGDTPGYSAEYKFMGATPDTQVTIPAATALQPAAAAVVAYRGVDTTTPLDVTTTTATGSAGTPNSPSITTTTDGALVVAFGAHDDDDIDLMAPPEGFIDFILRNAGVGNSATVMVAHRVVATAGTVNPTVFSADFTDDWFAATIALRPAATSGGTTYSESITLAGEGGTTSARTATLGASFTLAGEAAATEAARADFSAGVTLAGNATVDQPSGGLTLDQAAVLAAIGAVTSAGGATAEGAIDLNGVLGVTPTALQTIAGLINVGASAGASSGASLAMSLAATLSASSGLTTGSTAAVGGSVEIGAQATAQALPRVDLVESFGFQISGSAAASGGQTSSGAISLGGEAGATVAPTWTLAGTVSLPGSAGASAASRQDASLAASFGAVAGMTQQGGVGIIDEAISLSGLAGAVIAAALVARGEAIFGGSADAVATVAAEYQPAAAFAGEAGASSSANLSASGDATLAAAASAAASAAGEFRPSVSLGAEGGATGAAAVNVQQAAAFEAAGGTAASAAGQFQAGATLAGEAGAAALGGLRVSRGASYAIEAGITASGGLIVSGSVSLATTGGVGVTSSATLGNAVSFTATLDAAAAGSLSIAEAIALAIEHTFQTVGRDPSVFVPRRTIALTGSMIGTRELQGSMVLEVRLDGAAETRRTLIGRLS